MRHLMCSGISTIIAQKNVSKIFLRIVEYWIFQSSVISADHSKRNNKVIILKDSVTIQILKRNSRLLHCVVFKSFTIMFEKSLFTENIYCQTKRAWISGDRINCCAHCQDSCRRVWRTIILRLCTCNLWKLPFFQ